MRLSWQQGWAAYEGEPNQSGLFADGDRLSLVRNCLERAGVAYQTCFMEPARGYWKDEFSGPVEWVDLEQAKREIFASIDRGVPVVIHCGETVFFLAVGYGEDTLWGIAVFVSPEERIPPYQYARFKNWDDVYGYFLVEDYTHRSMGRELLLQTLQTAVSLARTDRNPRLGETALGVSSFDAVAEHMVWDEGFANLSPHEPYIGPLSWQYDRPDGYYRTAGARTLADRFWAGYCDFLCMLNGYCNFSRFLLRYSEILPDWSDKLKEAAGYYDRACDYSGALWQYVTADDSGLEKFKTDDVRSILAAHMLRAKIYTLKAVEIFEQILEEANERERGQKSYDKTRGLL